MNKVFRKIPYALPSISDKEIKYVEDAIRYGWGERCNEYINRFTEAFRLYTDAKFAIPTSSCTGAIHMALATIGIKPGDEVIAPDFTWAATVAPITYLGATPVLVDVTGDTWCIDPVKIEQAITSKTKAIIAVHLYGNLCDMDTIMEIAKRNKLYVIEDSAEAIGSYYKNRHSGTIGDFGTFSFHGTKTITTGEGGMLLVNNPEHYNSALTLSNHGRERDSKKQFWCEKIGFKYKMSNLQAAVGLAQVERIEELTQRKRQIFFKYKDILDNHDVFQLNCEPDGTLNSFWMPTVFWNAKFNINREHLLRKFNESNIDSRVVFYPVSKFPGYKKIFKNENTYSLYYRGMNLPSYHSITDEDIERVCDILLAAFGVK